MPASITFPATLPGVSMDNYEYTPENNIIRTEMDAGPARQRRRYTRVPTKINVTWKLSLEQLRIFENFFRFTIMDGVAWFNINMVNGSGNNSVEARFVKPYTSKAVANGQSWSVSGELEILQMPTL